MTRFGGDDDGDYGLYGLWFANVQRALNGKRGQQALRDLETALVALPEKRLIEGTLATVEGEVCALGALAMHKLGHSATDLYWEWAGSNGEEVAAELGRDQLGLTYTLAWEIQHRNDEAFSGMSPEMRYEAMLTWVRARLRA